MTPSHSELDEILAEMDRLSLRRQQLLEREKIQGIFQEMRKRAEFRQTEEAASDPHDSIDDQLRRLAERKAELQRRYDCLLNGRNSNSGKNELTGDPDTGCVRIGCRGGEVVTAPREVRSDGPVPCSTIFYVESPPNTPAPAVILNLEELPDCPCRTQCPECKQFVMTETFHSVTSLSWLVCFMAAMVGCVAGCCLLPFCTDTFKSTTHRCPRCRSAIRTLKKL